MAVKVDNRAWGVTFTQAQADSLDADLVRVQVARHEDPDPQAEELIEALNLALERALEMLDFAWPAGVSDA